MKALILFLLSFTWIFGQSYSCDITEKTFTGPTHLTYINYEKSQKSVTHNDGTVTILVGNSFSVVADMSNKKSITHAQSECSSIGFKYRNGKCDGNITKNALLAVFNKADPTGTYSSLIAPILDTIPSNDIGWRFIGDYDGTETLYIAKEGFTRSWPNKTNGERSKAINFEKIVTNNNILFHARDGGILTKSEIKVNKQTRDLLFTMDTHLGFFEIRGQCITNYGLR